MTVMTSNDIGSFLVTIGTFVSYNVTDNKVIFKLVQAFVMLSWGIIIKF